MTIQQAQQEAVSRLRLLYEEREAANIADWVLEHVTGKKKIARLLDKHLNLSPQEEAQLKQYLNALALYEPVQYVLGEAWFAGMRFYVDRNVLIPRPETEELVDWVDDTITNSPHVLQHIIDIGTGSGCIPISLQKKQPQLRVQAVDISEGALNVARKNADALGATVQFSQLDFLNEANWHLLPSFDVIISNPPYIKQSEEKDMAQHVLAFEPSLALFVPDNDALIFYRKIAAFGKSHLSPNGFVFVEINEALGAETKDLFAAEGYEVELRKDMQGKDRMIRAWLPPGR